MLDRFGWVLQLVVTWLIGKYLLPLDWGLKRWLLAVPLGMVAAYLLVVAIGLISSRRRA